MHSSNSKSQSKGIVVALTSNNIMGVDNDLPWCYPKDLKRFKKLTVQSTVIMGRRTWESIGCKELPNRRNIVITSKEEYQVETYKSITQALLQVTADTKVWFIGGASIYKEAMSHCDTIDVTLVPDQIDSSNAIVFPEIPSHMYTLVSTEEHPYDARLKVKKYARNR